MPQESTSKRFEYAITIDNVGNVYITGPDSEKARLAWTRCMVRRIDEQMTVMDLIEHQESKS